MLCWWCVFGWVKWNFLTIGLKRQKTLSESCSLFSSSPFLSFPLTHHIMPMHQGFFVYLKSQNYLLRASIIKEFVILKCIYSMGLAFDNYSKMRQLCQGRRLCTFQWLQTGWVSLSFCRMTQNTAQITNNEISTKGRGGRQWGWKKSIICGSEVLFAWGTHGNKSMENCQSISSAL